MRQIVDVLGGARKVHVFKEFFQIRLIGETLFDVVLDCLYIMIRCAFDRLDACRGLFIKIICERFQPFANTRIWHGYFRN